MPEPSNADFDLLLNAARTGDESAMQRLVQQYEPELRIVARHRLGPALRPHLDTIDLVQSVHRSLLIGLRAARFDISSPEKLIALAVTIVQRKAAKHWRHLKRQQRLSGHDESHDDLVEKILSLRATTGDIADEVESRELFSKWLETVDSTERRLLELRLEGHSTVEVARLLDLDPDVLRVKLSRLRKKLRQRGLLDDLL
ncbi:MAG: sigma-70 family RNA polymerase sigma factor [Planctomycetaceae bacterium]|nr:sigma-70 family RNA polymerase sigma factor [Planctomycetaceae bacterium]